FPLYLVLINLFVIPIALAGLLTFSPGHVDSDMFVLALPLAAHSDLFTIAAFVGGLSAATAMVIVESVALAIMVSNDIVMPVVLQRRAGLIYRRATARGAMAGMTVGILVWDYTLLLPSMADAGIIGQSLLSNGPWGLTLLRPQALLGLDLP